MSSNNMNTRRHSWAISGTRLLCTLLISMSGFSQKNQRITRSLESARLIKPIRYGADESICSGHLCLSALSARHDLQAMHRKQLLDEKPSDPMKIPLEKKLRVMTQRPDSLTIGKRYLFTLRFKSRKDGKAGDLEMVSFKPL